jgi:ferredoxin-NADP reductase
MNRKEGEHIPLAEDKRAMPFHMDAAWIGTRVPLARADFYLAGSRSFIKRLGDELISSGVSPTALHAEIFG